MPCVSVVGIVCGRMTKFDIRNYFEKIYSVKVSKVNTRVQLGMANHYIAGIYIPSTLYALFGVICDQERRRKDTEMF